MSERATLEELKDFANKVREAGGGNPLDALMPATPADPAKCLIAKNLNFNCNVNQEEGHWYMGVDDEEIAKRICDSLGLKYRFAAPKPYERSGAYRITLPDNIGQVANDFDCAWELVAAIDYNLNEWTSFGLEERAERGDDFVTWFKDEALPELQMDYPELQYDLELIKEMWPYIDESRKETIEIGVFNDRGELIL